MAGDVTCCCSSISDCMIFLFLGLELVTVAHEWNTGFCLSALGACLLFRLIGTSRAIRTRHYSRLICTLFVVVVFILTHFINKANPLYSINYEEQFIMVRTIIPTCILHDCATTCTARARQVTAVTVLQWYGGLRGAVCFALCGTINDDFHLKSMFLTATLFVIFFTVFVQV